MEKSQRVGATLSVAIAATVACVRYRGRRVLGAAMTPFAAFAERRRAPRTLTVVPPSERGGIGSSYFRDIFR